MSGTSPIYGVTRREPGSATGPSSPHRIRLGLVVGPTGPRIIAEHLRQHTARLVCCREASEPPHPHVSRPGGREPAGNPPDARKLDRV